MRQCAFLFGTILIILQAGGEVAASEIDWSKKLLLHPYFSALKECTHNSLGEYCPGSFIKKKIQKKSLTDVCRLSKAWTCSGYGVNPWDGTRVVYGDLLCVQEKYAATKEVVRGGWKHVSTIRQVKANAKAIIDALILGSLQPGEERNEVKMQMLKRILTRIMSTKGEDELPKWYHATSLSGLNGIFQQNALKGAQPELLVPGVWFSRRPEMDRHQGEAENYGDLAIAFSSTLESLDCRKHESKSAKAVHLLMQKSLPDQYDLLYGQPTIMKSGDTQGQGQGIAWLAHLCDVPLNSQKSAFPKIVPNRLIYKKTAPGADRYRGWGFLPEQVISYSEASMEMVILTLARIYSADYAKVWLEYGYALPNEIRDSDGFVILTEQDEWARALDTQFGRDTLSKEVLIPGDPRREELGTMRHKPRKASQWRSQISDGAGIFFPGKHRKGAECP